MNPWHDVTIGKEFPDAINMIVEIPKDSPVKYELDKETGLLIMDRFLYSSMHYPGDYGFVPQTLWDDGDPLDIFVFTSRPIHPMTLCKVRIIGVVHMDDQGESDDKIIGVYAEDPRYADWSSIDQVPKHNIKELRNFLERYKELQNKEVKVFEISGPIQAIECVRKSQRLYNEKFRKADPDTKTKALEVESRT